MRAPGGRGRPRSRQLLSWLTMAAVVLLDQTSKIWAVRHLPTGDIKPLLPGLLQFQRVSNTGAAFSLFADATLMLGVISAIVSVAVALWILLRPPLRPWEAMALGFLLGGAVGNGIDRWRLGAVVDFLEFVPIHFPIFNVADVAINLAIVCFAIDLLRQGQGPERRVSGRRDG